MTEVKICGLTSIRDTEALNQYGADYAGMVLFYPESRRNLQIEAAAELLKNLKPEIKKVAVMVSPSFAQAEVCKKAGFDYLQIHGRCSRELLNQKLLPVFLAVNVLDKIGMLEEHESIVGYVFDGRKPGQGKRFDWELLKGFGRKGKKMMLAGGLNSENVVEGIHCLRPDIVDVSSGVEYADGSGKNPEQIWKFIDAVRRTEQERK